MHKTGQGNAPRVVLDFQHARGIQQAHPGHIYHSPRAAREQRSPARFPVTERHQKAVNVVPVKQPPPPPPRLTAQQAVDTIHIKARPQWQQKPDPLLSAALQHEQTKTSAPSLSHWFPRTKVEPFSFSPAPKQTDMQPDAHIAADGPQFGQPHSPGKSPRGGVKPKGRPTQPADSLLTYEEWKEAMEFNPQYADWLQKCRKKRAMAQAQHGGQ